MKGSPNEGLLGATLGFFFGFAAVATFGPAANEFDRLLKMGPVMVGLLVAVPSLSGSLLRIPFASWVDTTGGRKPFLILLSLAAVGMFGLLVVLAASDFLLAQAPWLFVPALLICGVLSGCGIATFSVGISQVSYWFPQVRQGWALGTFAGIGNVAPGLFSFLLPVAFQAWGLTVSYLLWLIFLVVGLALYYVLGRNAWYFQLRESGLTAAEARETAQSRYGQQILPAGTFTQSLSLSARVWKTWVLVAVYFTTFGGFIALTAWLPTYWKSFLLMDAVAAGLFTAVFSLLASAIRVAGGSVSDRLGGENTAMLALATMLAGALVMMVSGSVALSLTGEIIMALGMGVGNAAVFKVVPQEVPQAVGGAAGWVGGLGAFGGFVIPPLMSLFVAGQGVGGYASGFMVFVVLAGVSLGLAYLLKQVRAAHLTKIASGSWPVPSVLPQ